MTTHEACIGTRVRTNVALSGIPRWSEGVIDEDYGTGVMVAWDLPGRPLPSGYRSHQGVGAEAGILRDGFDKVSELHFLQVVTART